MPLSEKPWTGVTPIEISPLNTSTKVAYRCPACNAEGYQITPLINVNDAREPVGNTLDHFVCPSCGRAIPVNVPQSVRPAI